MENLRYIDQLGREIPMIFSAMKNIEAKKQASFDGTGQRKRPVGIAYHAASTGRFNLVGLVSCFRCLRRTRKFNNYWLAQSLNVLFMDASC